MESPWSSYERPRLLGARPLPSDSISWVPFAPMASCSAAELYSDMSFQFCWAVSSGPGHVSLSLSPSVQSLLGGRGGGGGAPEGQGWFS